MRTWIAIAVSLVSAAAVAWWAANQSAPTLPTSGRAASLVLAALGVYAASIAVRGWRWHTILSLAHVDHRTADAYGLTVVAYMGNTVLPARGGELVRVILLSDRSGAPKREVFGSILAERLLDLAVVIPLFCLVVVIGIGDGSTEGAARIALAAGLAAVAVLALLARIRRGRRFERVLTHVRPFARASRTVFGRDGLRPGAATAAAVVLDSLAGWLLARSVGLDMSLVEAFYVLALAGFATTIPALPGFVGTFDGALVFALETLDVTGGDALAFVVLVRFLFFAPVTIAGLAVLVTRYGGFGRLLGLWRRRTPELPQAEPDGSAR